MEEVKENARLETSRLDNLDLLKCLAIVFMILCHPVFMMGQHYANYEEDWRYFLADVIFGDYLFVAHAFMFCMGVGFVYSRRQDAKYLLQRGIYIYILSYVLNFFRYGIYPLGEGIVLGHFRDETFYAITSPDILMFAGCAMMLTALMRKLKLKPIMILLIGLLLSIVASFVSFPQISNPVLALVVGTFFVTVPASGSCFTLCNWYLFVAAGIYFGSFLKKVQVQEADKSFARQKHLYEKLFLGSAIVMVIYILLTLHYGCFFLTKDHYYDGVSTGDAIGLLSIDLTMLSLAYFLLKKFPLERYFNYHAMSQNILTIYCIHWIIIGFIDSAICYGLEIKLPYWLMYLIGLILVILTPFLAQKIQPTVRIWKGKIMPKN